MYIKKVTQLHIFLNSIQFEVPVLSFFSYYTHIIMNYHDAYLEF